MNIWKQYPQDMKTQSAFEPIEQIDEKGNIFEDSYVHKDCWVYLGIYESEQ